jgi:hypothetical protein
MENRTAKIEPDLRQRLDSAHQHALSHIERLDQASVAATADLATLRAQISRPLTREGTAPEQVIEELVRDVRGGLLGSAGGRFFGWVIGGVLCWLNFCGIVVAAPSPAAAAGTLCLDAAIQCRQRGQYEKQ